MRAFLTGAVLAVAIAAIMALAYAGADVGSAKWYSSGAPVHLDDG